MVALVATLLLAAYVLGPDLVARWVLGFVVPRQNLALTKSEEITRGVLWSILPFWLAWSLRHIGPLPLPPNLRLDLQVFFSGLYSESSFHDNSNAFFIAAGAFLRFNASILVRLYTVVVVSSLLLNFLIRKYRTIRDWMGSHRLSFMRPVLALIVLPRFSRWHVFLSPILLPSKKMNIEVDILTKNGVLYQGAVREETNIMVSSDGNLQCLTLASPRRFRREQFLEQRRQFPDTKVEDYWKAIPGNMFVVVGSDITTLNVRHMPSNVRPFGQRFTDIGRQLNRIKAIVEELQKTQERPDGQTQSSLEQ